MGTIREYPEADSLQATDAFVLDRVGVGTMFVDESTLLGSLGIHFVLGFAYNGDPLLVNQVFGQYTFAQDIVFPANFAGAEGVALSLPTSNPWTCPIFQQPAAGGAPVQMATMSWTSSGVLSFIFTADAPFTFSAGDTIYAKPSSVDATITNFSYTLLGSLAS